MPPHKSTESEVDGLLILRSYRPFKRTGVDNQGMAGLLLLATQLAGILREMSSSNIFDTNFQPGSERLQTVEVNSRLPLIACDGSVTQGLPIHPFADC